MAVLVMHQYLMPQVLAHPQDVLSPQAVAVEEEAAATMEFLAVLVGALDQLPRLWSEDQVYLGRVIAGA
jgi:hypothetical protein